MLTNVKSFSSSTCRTFDHGLPQLPILRSSYQFKYHFKIPPISIYVIHSHKLFHRSAFFLTPISPLSLDFSNPYFLVCPINPNCLFLILRINVLFLFFFRYCLHTSSMVFLTIFYRSTLLLTERNCHPFTAI